MKKRLLLFSLIFLFANTAFAQISKKLKHKSVYTSTLLTFYPASEPYSFFSEAFFEQDALILNFITYNSGTFIVEDFPDIPIEVENVNKFPSQLFNIGASFQIRNLSSLYQEFTLSRFSTSKSSYINQFNLVDTSGTSRSFQVGYEQKSAVLSLRYELGKYFGKSSKAPMRFGLAGSVEPTFYSYNRKPLSTQNFPIKANITTINVALIPFVSVRLNKKISLDFKLIPNILIADFGEIRISNPALALSQQLGEREYSLPEIKLAGSLQLRYQLKEAEKKKRRSRGN